jgi:hypothetical protein
LTESKREHEHLRDNSSRLELVEGELHSEDARLDAVEFHHVPDGGHEDGEHEEHEQQHVQHRTEVGDKVGQHPRQQHVHHHQGGQRDQQVATAGS